MQNVHVTKNSNTDTVYSSYIDFLRFVVEEGKEVPASAKSIDWNDYLEYCNRQGVIGLIFEGIQRADLRIPLSVLFKWITFAESIKTQNRIVNYRILQTVEFFKSKGHDCVIMKGQANSIMYPKPETRSPGDIDIWIDGKRENIIKLVLNVCPKAHYSIHHIKLPIFKDVSVEAHYRPIYMANWFADRKLQRFIHNVEKRQFKNKVAIEDSMIGCLTDDFNVVYQMLHMYHHFFETRNSFKQFIDYYYLLRRWHPECTEITDLFRELGILKYAKGVMWVMKEVLGLKDKCLVVEPNEKEGQLILQESFYFGMWSTNKLKALIEQYVANFRIVRHYPKEVIIRPIFLVWHQWWKLKMKWKLRKVYVI